ncbi:MAG: PAS domain-containing protein [Candidatus Aenigmatarchaeota archaeon]
MTMEKDDLFGIEKKILDAIPELVVLQDKDMKILWANKSACDSVNKKPEELLGLHCYEIWHKRKTPCENCPVRRAWESETKEEGEVKTPDGRIWSITAIPIKGKKGKIIQVLEITKEITEVKKVYEKLNKSEKKYRAIFETSPDVICVFDQKGNLKDVNKKIYELTGYRPEELIGKNIIKLPWLTKQSKLKAMENLTKRFKGIDLQPFELEFINKDGKILVGLVRGGLLKDEEGNVEDIVFITDITQRKKMEEELKKSTEEAEKFIKLSVDRELKMVELKNRIKELENKLKEKSNSKK